MRRLHPVCVTFPMFTAFYSISFFLLSVTLISLLLRSRSAPSTSSRPLPPSPPHSLPLLGHLHLVGKPLHCALSLTSPTSTAPSSSSDSALAPSSTSPLPPQPSSASPPTTSPSPTAHSSLPAGSSATITPAWASPPYGPLWRDLRRIPTLELFSTHRLSYISLINSEEVASLVKGLALAVGRDHQIKKVEMRWRLFGLALNVMIRMAVGERHYGEDAGAARRLREIVEETFRLVGDVNVGDFVPALRWVGKLGVERTLRALRKRRDEFLQGLIEEREGDEGELVLWR